MELLTSPSKTDQIVDYFKVAIGTQKLKPGDKLMSIRKVANFFSVSPCLVVNAFEALEQEKLIRREHGRGVFVRSYSSNANIEVCLLAWNIGLSFDPYFVHLTHMASPPYLQAGFNFTVRTVPFSREATTDHFTHELQKFDKMCHADCLLLNAPKLSSSKINACLELNTPVLFIGDFAHELDSGISLNQVTADNMTYGENCVRQLVKQKKITEFVLYTLPLEYYFCHKFYEGALRAAKALNVKMHLIELPKGFARLDIQEQNEIFLQKTKESGITKLHDIPAINGGVSDDFLRQQIKLGKACLNIYYHISSQKDILNFYNTIFDEIKRITKKPNETKKIILKEDLDNFRIKRL